MKLRLSILDQTPIRKGSNAYDSLQESVELAQLADGLGFTRYWISEHHNTKTLANGAPEVLIARLAANTQRIRFGSGGIMLPNHSALKVAENFRTLEALYPGRIDLGIGRAPGGDRMTAKLLNPSNDFDPQEYLRQISDLQDYLQDNQGPDSGTANVIAIPSIETAPAIWALTSSGESAYIAAHFGLGLSFAQFINPIGGPAAVKLYKERFKPSAQFPEPETNVGIFAFCSDDKEKVRQATALFNYRLLSFEKGNYNQLYSFEDIKDYKYSPAEENRLVYHSKRYITGTPDEMEEKLVTLAKEFGTDEIVIATFADTKEDRSKSYELLGKTFLV